MRVQFRAQAWCLETLLQRSRPPDGRASLPEKVAQTAKSRHAGGAREAGLADKLRSSEPGCAVRGSAAPGLGRWHSRPLDAAEMLVTLAHVRTHARNVHARPRAHRGAKNARRALDGDYLPGACRHANRA